MSAPATAVDSWDSAVRESTANFKDGTCVTLLVKDRAFEVSRARLSAASCTMADLFSMPQPNGPLEPITLSNKVQDVEHFLWFLHVHPINFTVYMAKCPKSIRFERAMGIAAVAHMYLATTVEQWAVQEMFDMFPHRNPDSPSFAQLYRQAQLCSTVTNDEGGDIGDQLFQAVRTHWCNQVRAADDPIAMLLDAKKLGDRYLQAYSYFHILKLTNGTVSNDERLTVIDHLRLMNGSINLRRYDPPCDCTCNCYGNYSCSFVRGGTRQQATAEKEWSMRVYCNILDKYDGRTLWEMFEYSPTLRSNLSSVVQAIATGSTTCSSAPTGGRANQKGKGAKKQRKQVVRAAST